MQKVVDAIKDDDVETVIMILEDGLDPNSRYTDKSLYGKDAGLTLLHWAARFDAPASTEVFAALSFFCFLKSSVLFSL